MTSSTTPPYSQEPSPSTDHLSTLLAENHKNQQRSEIRELLKRSLTPGMISFGGGLPDPAHFPVDVITAITGRILRDTPERALQYGETEGAAPLREVLAERHRRAGFEVTAGNIMVTNGSQQALDLVAKIFLNPGDVVITGLPTYMAALTTFRSYGARCVGVPLDDEGMSVSALTETLERLRGEGTVPKFCYVVPDFQNPAGVNMSEPRRCEIVSLCAKHRVLLVEDSPYREFRYRGPLNSALYTLAKPGGVINFGTLSKIFLPGLRIGWVIAPEPILERFIIAKQSADLCTSPLNQLIAAEFLAGNHLDDYLAVVREDYHHKKIAMISSLERHMPPGVTWSDPDGGLFLFLRFPQGVDSADVLQESLARGVAFVTGTPFFADGSGRNTARLNYSFGSVERNEEGIARLAEAVNVVMKRMESAERSV